MPQDAFTIKYVANELNELLCGGKISKITQPDKETLTFIIYTRNGSVKLEICLSAKGCRINIADDELAAPKVAPNFCMLLRKHLQNAEITAVKQIEYERLVYFDLDCTSEFERTEMRLYVELMGKYSNAVLTKDGIILGALKTTAIGESTRRVLFSGVKYVLPEPQDKILPDDLKALERAFENAAGDRAKFIADKVKGIAYSTALEIVETYGEKLSAKAVNSYICGGQIAPCVTFSDGEPSDFKVRSTAAKQRGYGSVLAAQTAYYKYVSAKKRFDEKKRKLQGALSAAVKKLEKRLAEQNRRLLGCADADLIKLKGELITANIYAVQRGADKFEAVNYYDENGGKIEIALDRTLSPAENAQKYYKRYAKMRRTVQSVSVQKRETEERLDYLNSISVHACAAENLSDLDETEEELKILGLLKDDGKDRKKAVKTAPFREFEIGGFKVLAGRNNIQNDRLLKSVSPNDLWLHTQGYHSSHLVIIRDGKEIPDEVIKIAAEICAYYSDGRAGSKVPVDYTLKKFVKKPPKANAGFVVYTDYKTALAEPNGHAELLTEKL